jgi:hypothetical protein
MGEEVITTGVDDLLDYLKGKDRVAMQDVATFLSVSMDTLQAWTDFLVEEKILGIEYKFTKPYIYLNQVEKSKHKQVVEQAAMTLEQIKQEYKERAMAKQMPIPKIIELWRAHVQEALESKKEFFFEQASRKNASNPQQLWSQYREDLLRRC